MSRIYSILIIFIFNIGIYSNNTINALPAFDLSIVSFSRLKQLNDFLINNLPVNQLKKVAAKKSSAVVLIYTISNKGKDKNNFYNSAVQPRVNKTDYKYGVTNGVMVSPDGMVVTTYTGTMNSDKYIVAIDSEKHQNNESYELPVIYGSEEESDNSNTEEEDDDYSNATYKDNENSKKYNVDEENNSTKEASDNADTESNSNKSINKYEGFNSIEEYLDKLENESNNDNNKVEENNKNNNGKNSEDELLNLNKALKAMNNEIKSIKANTNSNKTNRFVNNNTKKYNKESLNIQLDNNTYMAKVLMSVPELNIVVLKLKCNKSEKFNYFNITNDQFFQTKKDQDNKLLYNSIAIGKCKGDHYARLSKPYNSKNKFDITKTVIGSISYKLIKGMPTLLLYTPLTGDSALPENHGGALLNDRGQLIGIPYVDWSIHDPNNKDLISNRIFTTVYYDCFANLPFGYAIPASTIKKILVLISLKLTSQINWHSGVIVNYLSKYQKQILKYFFKKSTKLLKDNILKHLHKIYGLEKYSSIDKYIDNNQFGVVVTGIKAESPAYKANIKLGDIILNLNTECVTSPTTFYNLEISNIEKSILNFKIFRNRKLVIMEVKR